MTLKELAIQNRRIDAHRPALREWLGLHEKFCQLAVSYGEEAKALVVEKLFRRVTDDRNLICAYEHIARTSGGVAGPDRCTISGMEAEKYAFARFLRDELRAKRYSPSDPKVIRVRKRSGRGYRKIQIHNICDRIVQRAVVQVLQPLLDPQFLPISLGFRPGLQRNHALAKAEIMLDHGYTAVVTEDLSDAFDCVPQRRLLDVLRKYAPDRDFISLVRKLVVTPEGTGIAQGSPLSPLLLNLYLHHTLDRLWPTKVSQVYLMRYADDVALFCLDKDEARRARSTLEDLVRSAGFRFRGTSVSKINDLSNGETFEWLGYLIGNTFGNLEVNIPESAWRSVNDQIRQLIGHPKLLARSVFGWFDQFGPTFNDENVKQVILRINSMLQDAGSRLRFKPERIKRRWGKALIRWENLRDSVRIGPDLGIIHQGTPFEVPVASKPFSPNCF